MGLNSQGSSIVRRIHAPFYDHFPVNCVLRALGSEENKAGYTATLVACGGAGAVMEKVTGAFGQEQ